MALRRFLGLGSEASGPAPRQTAGASADSDTVRRIIAELEQVDPEQRRFLAGFAYILARAAHSDLAVSAAETELMEQIVATIGGLPEAQAVLVVEIARHQTELYGATEDYLVTREFSSRSTVDQRRRVVEACFAVTAADHEITADEFAELTQIANELDLSRDELNEVRRDYRDHLAAIQKMRRLTPAPDSAPD